MTGAGLNISSIRGTDCWWPVPLIPKPGPFLDAKLMEEKVNLI